MVLLLALLQSTGVKVGEVSDTSALLWFRADQAGRMRVSYDGTTSDWAEAVAERDFTHVFKLDGLKPGSLVEYAADRLDRSAAGMTYDEADVLLAARGVDDALRRRFRTCLESCDFARFVPAASRPERRTELFEDATAIVEALERAW